ncbi:hypothetical protein TFLX_02908 [Thermoflexales bacterium]|nr:hypothetical protein TFLX_02908 [Thermoflexales bacterium]
MKFQSTAKVSVRIEIDLPALGVMALAAITITIVSCTVFYAGPRRYESGSALNVNI